MTTIYLLDDADIYTGALDIDPMSALPRCTLTPPPALTGTEAAQWRDGAWQVLPAYPQRPVPSSCRRRLLQPPSSVLTTLRAHATTTEF